MQQFAVQPHAAPVTKKKNYRDETEPEYINLMTDPRVVRGTTFASNNPPGHLSQTKTKKDMSRTLGATQKARFSGTRRGSTNNAPPVSSREYLEELTDRPIENDIDDMAQIIKERPASPLFVPARIGRDVETQIQAGDLFDFDLEVEPILEVLVGRTLHVSMLEVVQEAEIEKLHQKQVEFEGIRNIELAELQRLEAEDNRKQLERGRRLAQHESRIEEQRLQQETLTAKAFAHEYLVEMREGVMEALEEEGHFYDPVKKEISEEFLEAMGVEAVYSMQNFYAAQQLADSLLMDALDKAKEMSVEKSISENCEADTSASDV